MVLQQAEAISEDAQRAYQMHYSGPWTPWPVLWAIYMAWALWGALRAR